MSDSQPFLSILIVEDNPGDLFLLEELLRASSLPIHKLYKVTNSSQAITVLQLQKINVVLLDLSLPDSSGLHSYTILNQHAVSIPIIVLTGLIDMDTALETMARGAQDYLIKGEFDEKLLSKSIQYSIERKRNLENLRESYERYEFVTKATNDVVWDWNFETNQIYWAGDNLYRLLGYELPDGISTISFWEECLHPEDKHRVLQKLYQSISEVEQSLWQDEFRFKKANGDYAYILDKGYLLYSDKTPVRMIGSMQDITERKLAEIKVTDSERRFRSLVQSGSDMIKVLDPEGYFTFASPTVEKVLGYSQHSILGKNVFDFIHPDDLAFVQQQFRLLRQQETLEIPYFRLKNEKNEWRWLETTLANLLDDPSVNGIVSNSRDVTEKKQAEEAIRRSEERYRKLFFNNPMAIFIWDINKLDILEINDTCQQEYGYSRKEFLKMTIMDVRPSEDLEQVKEAVRIFAGSTDQIVKGVWRHIKKNGEFIFMDVSSHKIDFNGCNAVLTIANNITEKIKLENKLQEERQAKQKEITEAVIRVQEKERYEISRELHDNVNQQLTVAMMYIATAQKGAENHKELLKQSSGFIFNAIEEIRKLSKALVTPLIKDFGLSKAIDGLVEDIHVTNSMNIEFFSDSFYEEDINYEFKLNVFRIVQEQMNNIIKHANAKDVTIELYRSEYVTLSIMDNGVGFDSTIGKRNGIGINNIISRVELYNGHIEIQTAPGKGCRLHIKFPVLPKMLAQAIVDIR